jgi:diguanylate cyclase
MTPAVDPLDQRIEALLIEADALAHRHDKVQARRLNNEALRLCIEAQRPCLQVRAEALASMLAVRHGELPVAARHAATAKALALQLGDAVLLARAQIASARVSWTIGENDDALVELEAAIPAGSTCDDAMLRYYCQGLMGAVLSDLDRPQASLEWHSRARQTAAEAGLSALVAVSAANASGRYLELGEAAQAAGDAAGALQFWHQAIVAFDEATDLAQQANEQAALLVIAANRGSVMTHFERWDEALADFEQAYTLADALGGAAIAANVARYHTRMLQRRGDLAGARAQVQRGLQAAEAAGIKNQAAQLYALASELDELQGDFASALAKYKRFHALQIEVAFDQAKQRSEVLAVRLETQRALADVAQQRERVSVLAQANETLQQRAVTLSREALQDPLTGLANRRRLDAFVAEGHADAVARNVPYCLALLDLDHFKRVNDDHSHAVGDAVLRHIATLLRGQCRDNDLAARFGGEEFVVVIANVGLARATVVCERLRAVIEAFDWPSLSPGLAVTASLGLCDIAALPNPDAGLARADELLYQAKAAGRNRVVVGAAPAPPQAEGART